MTEQNQSFSRRSFITQTALASAGAALAVEALVPNSAQAKAPQAASPQAPAVTPNAQTGLPKGKIGNLEVGRLILGGNLLEHYAHSRDLSFVRGLAKAYNTESKVIETLKLAESLGVNTMSGSINPTCTNVLRKYREKHNGKIQWIICPYAPLEDGLAKFSEEVDKLMDWGCDAVYIWGVRTDELVAKNRVDLIGKAVESVKAHGVSCGVGGHRLEVVAECEKQKVPADFYIKTLHHHDYPSAKLNFDSLWCERPNELIELMQGVTKPWIAFKTMAAGAIPPASAFPFCFNNGADFVLAGMFDFEMAQDVSLAQEAIAKAQRKRPWRA
jgi:hypothetical protein